MKVERQMKRPHVSKVCLLKFFKRKKGRRQVIPSKFLKPYSLSSSSKDHKNSSSHSKDDTQSSSSKDRVSYSFSPKPKFEKKNKCPKTF